MFHRLQSTLLTFYLLPRSGDRSSSHRGVTKERSVVGQVRCGRQAGLETGSYRSAVPTHALPQDARHTQGRRSLRHRRQRHQVLHADWGQQVVGAAREELLLEERRPSNRLKELQRIVRQHGAVLLLDVRLDLRRSAGLKGVPDIRLQNKTWCKVCGLQVI